MPPALPATLSIGTSFALSRLRKSGIFCISPNRVNVSGKVNVCCFDKTGTLTEDGLDILGVRGIERNSNRFGELIDDVHDLPLSAGAGKASFLHALATCHMLQVVDEEIMGDPLDVKMFSFTQWKLEEGNVAGRGVIKDKASGTKSSAALVQTIVRPPGTASFKLEDALKGGSRVSSCKLFKCGAYFLTSHAARTLFRIGGDSNIRIRVFIAADERCCQETEKLEHGDLRKRCARGNDRHMRQGFP